MLKCFLRGCLILTSTFPAVCCSVKYGEHILNDLGCAFENISPFGFNADGCGSGGAGQVCCKYQSSHNSSVLLSLFLSLLHILFVHFVSGGTKRY
jgi:hypothetical protein